jgi:hypothetical protein
MRLPFGNFKDIEISPSCGKYIQSGRNQAIRLKQIGSDNSAATSPQTHRRRLRSAHALLAGKRPRRCRTIGGLQSFQLAVDELSFVARTLGAHVDPWAMGFAFLEACVQARAVFLSVDAFAGGSALDEVTNISVGSLCFALPLCHLRGAMPSRWWWQPVPGPAASGRRPIRCRLRPLSTQRSDKRGVPRLRAGNSTECRPRTSARSRESIASSSQQAGLPLIHRLALA